MDNFISSLDLPIEGTMYGNTYELKLADSNEFSRIYEIISNNENLHIEDESISTENNCMFRFTDGEYEVMLAADFERDSYRCTVEVR